MELNKRTPELKQELFEQFARITKALGSSRRFEIMDILSHGDHSVEELALETDMSIANTSQHLQSLRAAKLVEVRRKGVEMRYRIADETIFQLIQSIKDLAETRLPEVDRIWNHLTSQIIDIPIITQVELVEQITNGTIFLVDVRPLSEFFFAHIPGAHSFPLQDLKERLSEIPPDLPVVVYCRSYYSPLAEIAAKILSENGYSPQLFLRGFAEWKNAQLPIEQRFPL